VTPIIIPNHYYPLAQVARNEKKKKKKKEKGKEGINIRRTSSRNVGEGGEKKGGGGRGTAILLEEENDILECASRSTTSSGQSNYPSEKKKRGKGCRGGRAVGSSMPHSQKGEGDRREGKGGEEKEPGEVASSYFVEFSGKEGEVNGREEGEGEKGGKKVAQSSCWVCFFVSLLVSSVRQRGGGKKEKNSRLCGRHFPRISVFLRRGQNGGGKE